nr:3652_t:CDS:2 [Entrophospora candida]
MPPVEEGKYDGLHEHTWESPYFPTKFLQPGHVAAPPCGGQGTTDIGAILFYYEEALIFG